MVRITLLNKEMADVPVPVVITGIKYGLLYNWYAATDERNIAADGWTIPTVTECNTMLTFLGGASTAGIHLKEANSLYWNDISHADNSSKFNGRGSGARSTAGLMQGIKVLTAFHTTTNIQKTFQGGNDFVAEYSYGGTIGVSIRLIKTTTSLSDGDEGVYIGNDGKVYRTICIGTQEWLADNLCETKYRNGDTIPEVTDNSAWAALETGALCAYDNDWSNVLL